MRPVILLNDEALHATGEAEAIIAHELAHVARFDWAKLMLARVATAIFWFNPLAWVLAREAHQLREESADDAVLAADIADTDYAQLLVGVARHECKGMLLGAHGISPGRGSLRRRVSRVLDASLARSPGGRSWVAGFAAGMLVISAPLAALTFSPAAPKAPVAPPRPPAPLVAPAAPVPPVAAIAPLPPQAVRPRTIPQPPVPPVAPAPPLAGVISTTVSTAISTSFAAAADALRQVPDIDRIQRDASRASRDADRVARRAMREVERRHPPGTAAQAQLLGVTPAYAAEIRAAAPQFRKLDDRQMIDLHVQRVTPQFVRGLASAGYGDESVAAIAQAAMLGLTVDTVRDYARLGGPRRPLAELTELRMMGVTPDFVARTGCCERGRLTKDQLIRMRLTGMPVTRSRPPIP